LPHRRSPQGFVKQFLTQNSFHDIKKQETINLATPEQISAVLQVYYDMGDNVLVEHLSDHPRGEVLFDGYGMGSFQRE